MKFKLFIEQNEAEMIGRLRQQMSHLDLQSHSILGHGTTPPIADKITREGLKYSDPNLDRQVIALFDGSVPVNKQPDEYFHNILNWQHKNSKGIVVIVIPNKQKNSPGAGGEQYFNSVWEEIPKDQLRGENDSVRYYIPPHYIAGWIDATTAEFHKNPSFSPKPLNIKNLRHRGIKNPGPQAQTNQNIPIPQPTTTDGFDVF
jgi:hypothetical protein